MAHAEQRALSDDLHSRLRDPPFDTYPKEGRVRNGPAPGQRRLAIVDAISTSKPRTSTRPFDRDAISAAQRITSILATTYGWRD